MTEQLLSKTVDVYYHVVGLPAELDKLVTIEAFDFDGYNRLNSDYLKTWIKNMNVKYKFMVFYSKPHEEV